ncbi:LysR family transcriptional regulator [Alkalicoccobacillus murimartini]|uniref:DNA-binding transcriptional LysR family regulator n=1 Tax=Alkalicoccobacillus murimartini TaxID=171685 RepID=A0ABT9YID8_9BACI|nr:LysR family transcriptional regulator [Alkalicoccobacillus murimartini]MDQ0207621.1 DNA-binding transcriptional LysR family regulator [Alkalicoccobacillus murimartini]
MELRHLVTFIMIVQKMGFKKAADELGYAQSSVTNHIKELERELEKKLFDRLGSKIVLTEHGRKFLPYAKEIVEKYVQAKAVLQDDDQLTGELRIGASESLIISRMPEVLAHFKKMHPKVKLILRSINYQNLTSQFQSGELDLALIIEKDDWIHHDLYLEKMKLERMMIAGANLEKEDDALLYTEGECSYRSLMDELVISRGWQGKDKLEFWSTEAIKQCAISGIGKALLPYFYIKNEVEAGTIKAEEIHSVTRISSFAVCHKNKQRTGAIEEMMKVMREAAIVWK